MCIFRFRGFPMSCGVLVYVLQACRAPRNYNHRVEVGHPVGDCVGSGGLCVMEQVSSATRCCAKLVFHGGIVVLIRRNHSSLLLERRVGEEEVIGIFGSFARCGSHSFELCNLAHRPCEARDASNQRPEMEFMVMVHASHVYTNRG